MTDEQATPVPPAEPGEKADLFENLGRRLDEMPTVQAAERALHRATEELRRAQERYEQARAQAVEQIHDLRDKKASELVDATLECVRKHPGAGLLSAAFVGFLLGRLFRR